MRVCAVDMFCGLETILKTQDQLVNNLQQLDALMNLVCQVSHTYYSTSTNEQDRFKWL